MQMACGQAAFLVLNAMQILDQQRALERPFAKKRLHGRQFGLLQNATLREQRCLPPPRSRMDRAALARAISDFGSDVHAHVDVEPKIGDESRTEPVVYHMP